MLLLTTLVLRFPHDSSSPVSLPAWFCSNILRKFLGKFTHINISCYFLVLTLLQPIENFGATVFQQMHTFVANAEVDTSVMAILKRNVANYATVTQCTTPQFLWMVCCKSLCSKRICNRPHTYRLTHEIKFQLKTKLLP